MKNPWPAFLLLFVCKLLPGQTNPAAPSKHGYAGSVKSLHETVRYFDAEAVERSDKKVETLSVFGIDELLESVNVYRDGRLLSTLRYDYTDKNLPLAATEYNPDGSVYLKISYELDENGFVVAENYDRSEQKLVDENREAVDVEYYAYYQELFTSIRIKNEFTGRKVEQVFIKGDGQVGLRYTYEYDYRGMLTSSKYYHGNKELMWQTKYQYDRHMRLKLKKVFKSNYLIQTTRYTYETDSYGNWIVRTAKSKVVDNIFSQLLSEGTEITTRQFTYYD